ncbi:MAG TPA: non-canonical purine NTP pyrophosphatase [Rubrobacteraceae bacterium]|jgi:non-canonical purine NTP pyrophosphatase (RdgB/HAM1 family)|nr:non-canonical purine NTP pyrophosphatase [Rubrobacteraceae bacterium]
MGCRLARTVRAVFVTTNESKRREAQRILGVELESAALDVPEVQSLDFAEVAAHKARAAREALGSPSYPVLVEDSGIVLGAWNGLPGALTKWFVAGVGNEGILRMLCGGDRGARAVCAVAVAGAAGDVRVFEGVVEGEVAAEPRGEEGFGWDPIFVPLGGRLTYAEMGERKHEDSHRARAFGQVRKWLEKLDGEEA